MSGPTHVQQQASHFTPEQKAEIARRHVSGKEPVSETGGRVGRPAESDPHLGETVAGPLVQAEAAFEIKHFIRLRYLNDIRGLHRPQFQAAKVPSNGLHVEI
jgi:hypothetical protein